MKGPQLLPLVGWISAQVHVSLRAYFFILSRDNKQVRYQVRSPVTDGNNKIFGRRGEQLKVGNIQLLHLDGFTELDDEPGTNTNK